MHLIHKKVMEVWCSSLTFSALLVNSNACDTSSSLACVSCIAYSNINKVYSSGSQHSLTLLIKSLRLQVSFETVHGPCVIPSPWIQQYCEPPYSWHSLLAISAKFVLVPVRNPQPKVMWLTNIQKHFSMFWYIDLWEHYISRAVHMLRETRC